MRENVEVRVMVAVRNVQYQKIAEKLGITRQYMYLLMSKPLSAENKNRILRAVYELDQERKSQDNDNMAKPGIPDISKGKRQKVH